MTFASRLIYIYFRIALVFGARMHVYNVSGRWGSWTDKPIQRRYDVAWAIQKVLITQYGFFECPSCRWATKVHDEHLVEGQYCFDLLHGNPGVPWDEEIDPQLAYEKMPDRLR